MPGNWYQIGQNIYGESEKDRSGKSLSFSDDGKILAIGAHYNSSVGHVRIFKNNSGSWEQIGNDIDGENLNDEFGCSVSLSSDGSIVAIGAIKNDGGAKNSGHVRIYKNSSGSWEQIGNDIDGEGKSDNSGVSVSLSNDGSIVAIGANKNDDVASNSGHVRIYKNNSGSWEQIGNDIDGEKLSDFLGTSVSLSGDGSIVAIGANKHDGGGSNSGLVRIYKINSGSWEQLGNDIYGNKNEELGYSVSLSNDGSIVAIGAWLGDGGTANSGTVKVYEINSGSWEQIGSDIYGEKKQDRSGGSVSLSNDGTIVAIGALHNDGNGTDSGHVRIYKNNSGTWEQIGIDIDGDNPGDKFGQTISLSGDGSYLAVGALYNDENGTESGQVRVFTTIKDDGDSTFIINGIPAVGQNLSVIESKADPDGSGTLSYKWQSSLDGNTWSQISSNSTYLVTSTDQGKKIRVLLSYTDGEGFAEEVASSSVDIPYVDDGDSTFIINGIPAVGQNLSVIESKADPDGSGTLSYKWQSSLDGNTWSQISSNSTYLVTSTDQGKKIRVLLSYTDGEGFAEEVASSSVDIPYVDDGDSTFIINGIPAVGQNLSVIESKADPDGSGTLSYKWQSSLDGNTWSQISSNSTYLVTSTDQGKKIRVLLSYTDGEGFAEEVTSSSVDIPYVDDGDSTFIINGIPAVGQNLSVIESKADPDGSGTLSYKWQSSLDGNTWSQISSNSTYLVTSTDQGKKIRVLLFYTDGEGFAEEVASSSVNIPSYKIITDFAKGEGETFQTEIKTKYVEDGTRLFWGFSGNGITKNDFSEGALYGSFIVKVNEEYSFSHIINNDLMTEGTEDLKLKIFSDTERKNQLGDTATLKIYDTSKQVTYTNTVNNQISVLIVQEYGKFINNLTFDRLEIAPTIQNKPDTLEIGKTGINFSVELNNTSSKKISKTTTDLEPLIDGLTLNDKYLTYFSYNEASEGVAPDASTLTYDPTKKAGARFYDLDGDGSADTADLKLIDGGYGDKDGIVNGIIVDPSTAGTVDLKPQLFSRSQTLIVLDPSDITSPASLTIRASLSSSADSVNQIGYVAFNSNEEENITYELIEERGSIIFANLESTDVPDLSSISFQRDINLINGQKLVFFEIIDTTLESLLKDHKTIENFGESFRTLDINDVSTSSAVVSKGGNSVSISLIDSFSGLNEFISSEMDSDPILDFSGLASRNINGSVSISREAGYDSIIGFYKIQNHNGDVLDPLTGNLLSPGSDSYADAALNSINLFNEFGELSTENDSTKIIDISSFSNAGIIAPFANITTTGEKFFSFAAANSDGLSHFRSLGSGVIGVEDLKGGGDQDFDDLILSFDFQLTA